MAAHNTSEVAFAGMETGDVKVYDLRTGGLVKSLQEAHRGGVNAVEMDYVVSGYRFFTGGNDGLLKVWDMRKYECVSQVQVSNNE